MPSIRSTYKTRMCEFYLKNSCVKGDGCSYAHGEHELRSRSGAAHRPPLPANVWEFVDDELAANAARAKSSSATSESDGPRERVAERAKPSIMVDASVMTFGELVTYAEGFLIAGATTTRGMTCSFRARDDHEAALFEFHLGSNGIEASRVGEFVIVDFQPRLSWDMLETASD